ncbi:primosomal protein N' [Pseudoxanthomonas composti]|uniref:Replication restart protein PriA n=1 Tax=Pseudoxanthomonas composti TaxID=2137479 RepID=A0A4Q1JVC9_9GAMM|nr:primosomal protein N' [Pseudoxanthomonas composti]RXR03547.1 primosomal protein N' [Pseudoxanthomonas composti]
MPPVTTLRVALPVPLPRVFDYLPPESLKVEGELSGRRVRVSFGSRELVGLIVGEGEAQDADALKQALELLDPAPLLAGELWQSLQWLARYTHAPLGEVLATALPVPLRQGEPLAETRPWAWQLTEAGHTSAASLRTGTRPQRLAELLQAGTMAEALLDDRLEGWREAARNLAKRGFAIRVLRDAATAAPVPALTLTLNPEQQEAVAALRAGAGFRPILLEGVTGSGKTEVYLEAIADCIAAGKQALVLVPEIGLTPQTLARFRRRLGVPVHALHSGLSDTERAQTWAACWRGQAQVVVGTRSAVFAPLPRAGLIVIDEEHDGSYKQQDGIRYHARDFALVRGKALDVPVILGSATPSLETLHNVHAGRYGHLRLRQRAGTAQAPEVRVVDVRKRPLEAGLSPETLAAIDRHLGQGGQVLVFKNRRGYAPVLLCHDCGWSAHCRRCSTPLHSSPMTVHAAGKRLQCHHCGQRQSAPLACPDCGGLALQPQGVGTERLEEMLLQRYATVPVLRIDRSTTARKDGLEKLLAQLADGPGVLVGTQILAKGHDLPRLTLVVVVGVDEGLFSSDFRASEKLAQLLVQVAGRAGRAQRPGQVWLQTHHPGHPLLETLVHGGYRAFADAELVQRQAAGFPPFAHLALLRAEAKHSDPPQAFLQLARRALEEASGGSLEISGPVPAPMPRRAGYQRMQLIVSASQRRELHAALDAVLPALYERQEARRVRWSLDVDPIDLY